MTDVNVVLKAAKGGQLINVPGTLNSDGTASLGLASYVPVGNVATLDLLNPTGAIVTVPVTIENDGSVYVGVTTYTNKSRAYLQVQHSGGKPLLFDADISSGGVVTFTNASFSNPAVAPAYDSSEIGNVNTTTVAVRFSIPVSATNFATGVTIKKNTVSQTISSATLQADGVSVRYVITPAADANDVVTWEYASGSGNIVSQEDATALASVTAKTVTNHIAAVPPTFVSAEVGTVNDTTVEATFSVNLDATGSDFKTGFTIKVAGSTVAIGTGTRQANHAKIRFTVPAVTNGQAVTIAYAHPTGVVFNEADGGFMATFTAQAVTNNVP